MSTFFNYIRAVIFWFFFAIWTVFLFTTLSIHKLIYMLVGRPFENACHNYAILWAKGIFKATPGWHIEITGRENLPAANQAAVITANHESLADIWSLFFLDCQLRWFAKDELFRLPIIGHAMRWAGYIPIKRGDKDSHRAALKQSDECLQRGIPVVFFPEGTRSQTAEMRPFKIGAFKVASENNVPVIPTALKGAGQLIRKGSGIPRPATVRVQVLKPIHRLPSEDLEAFAARTRQIILEAHKSL